MEKEFVPYEIAKALEELGFKDKCIATIDQVEYIHIKGTRQPYRGAMMYDTIPCPLIQQAFRWFRTEHKFNSWIVEVLPNKYRFHTELWEKKKFTSDRIDNYEEAELECLKKLIEIVQNEK